MDVLLLGATGFIGNGVARALLEEGHSVWAVCRRGSEVHARIQRLKKIRSAKLRIPLVSTITAAELVPTLRYRAHFDVLINCIGDGMDPNRRQLSDLWQANVSVTKEAIDLCRHLTIPRIVLSGTGFEYGFSEISDKFSEQSPLNPRSLYSLSKALSYCHSTRQCRESGIQLIYLRIFGVIGPDDNAHRLVPSLARHLQSGRPIPLTDGNQVRDFLSVKDVGHAVIAAAQGTSNNAVETFNVCSGKGTAVRELVELVRQQFDAPSSLLLWGALPRRDTEGTYLVGDNRKLIQATHWTPRTNLAAAIIDSVSLCR